MHPLTVGDVSKSVELLIVPAQPNGLGIAVSTLQCLVHKNSQYKAVAIIIKSAEEIQIKVLLLTTIYTQSAAFNVGPSFPRDLATIYIPTAFNISMTCCLHTQCTYNNTIK